MNFNRIVCGLLGLGLTLSPAWAQEDEPLMEGCYANLNLEGPGYVPLQLATNRWPFFSFRPADDEGRPANSRAMGPFYLAQDWGERQTVGLRPLTLRYTWDARPEDQDFHVAYPIFNYHERGSLTYWDVYNLLRYRHDTASEITDAQLFPFVFHLDTPNPEVNYTAVWPVGGTLKNFFGRDRVDFAAWPLWVRTRRGENVRHSAPWPFVQYLKGPEARGFALWPLYGHFEQDRKYDQTYALWPIYTNTYRHLDRETPRHDFAVLPFYSRSTAEGLKSETFGWPFFGYTHESDPRPTYQETRYFWPLVVEGDGEERFTHRYLPFYTHEGKYGVNEKRWYAWPVLKRSERQERGMTIARDQLFYALWWDERRTVGGWEARRSYLWPLFGSWSDGEGSRQFQVLDPLGGFFPSPGPMRDAWGHLFALYRYDRRAETTEHEVLWNLVNWRRSEGETQRVQVGPLFEYQRTESVSNDARWEVLGGLVGRSGEPEDRRWKLFWNTF